MLIERIPETALIQADETAINALLTAAFAEDFDDRSYHQQRHTTRFVVREGAAIIGHMALCYRAIRLGENLVPIIGLAEVATDPIHQGKGIATALLAETLNEVRTTQAEFYLLFGVRPIYAGHGFRAVPNPVTHVEMYHARTSKITTAENTDLMVMQLRDRMWDDTAPIDLLGHMF